MADTVLQKPPRLLSVEQGAYDWREFDRWIRRVYDLLAVRADSKSYSVVDELDAIRSMGYLSSTSTTSEAEPAASMAMFYGSGNTNSSTATSDDYLTLYWMGV